MTKPVSPVSTAVTPERLARWGDGEIAYVKAIRSDDLSRVFPAAPAVPPGLELFALISADGSPIMVTDRRDAALASAWENALETVAVH